MAAERCNIAAIAVAALSHREATAAALIQIARKIINMFAMLAHPNSHL